MKSWTLKRLVLLIGASGVALASSAVSQAATGAGADAGTAESSVRIPKSNDTLGPADSASTVKAPIASVSPTVSTFDEVSLTVGNETYVSRTGTPGATSSFTEISGRIRKKSQSATKVMSAALDAGGSIATNANNYSNIEVPEAYFTISAPKSPERLANEASGKATARHAELSVGRKKERWSGLDSDWSLGIVQPSNKFDGLRPTEQGLAGAFVDLGYGPVQAVLFASPFFLPEQTAPYDLSNGRFTTASPWFSLPPDMINILNVDRSALYTIQMPAISEIVNHPSAGARLRLANPSGEGFYAQGSFLRAPQNTINLSFTGQLSIAGPSYGDVTVFPEVVYHTITAADVGYSAKNFTVEMAMLNEVPDQPKLQADLTTSHFEPMTMLSPSIELRTFNSKVWGPKLRVAYLDTHGGQVTPVGEYASSGNMFGPRLMLRRAVATSIESTLHRSSSWQLTASAKWIEELEERGTILLTDVGVSVGDSWAFGLQADFLGSTQPTTDTDTFIARFRANDRVGARVTYLF